MDTIQSIVRYREGIVQGEFQRRFVSEEMRVEKQEHRTRKVLSWSNKDVRAQLILRGYFRRQMYIQEHECGNVAQAMACLLD